ncbi:MAG: hypothetical protein K2Y28_07750, partial [Burkholderiaceae bacterium]|nr:hypothetical protein [Burkholderiaceae bacterium]
SVENYAQIKARLIPPAANTRHALRRVELLRHFLNDKGELDCEMDGYAFFHNFIELDDDDEQRRSLRAIVEREDGGVDTIDTICINRFVDAGEE